MAARPTTTASASAPRPAFVEVRPSLEQDIVIQEVHTRLNRLKSDKLRMENIKKFLQTKVPQVNDALNSVNAHCLYFQMHYPAEWTRWIANFVGRSELTDQISMAMKRAIAENDLIEVVNAQWRDFDWKFINSDGVDYTPQYQSKKMLEALRYISKRAQDRQAIINRLGTIVHARVNNRENSFGKPKVRKVALCDLEKLKERVKSAEERRLDQQMRKGHGKGKAIAREDLSFLSDKVDESELPSPEQARGGEHPLPDVSEQDRSLLLLDNEPPETFGEEGPLLASDHGDGPNETIEDGESVERQRTVEQPEALSPGRSASRTISVGPGPASPLADELDSVVWPDEDEPANNDPPSPAQRPAKRPRRARNAAGLPPLNLTRPPQLNNMMTATLREMRRQHAMEHAQILACTNDPQRLVALVQQAQATEAQIEAFVRLISNNPAQWQ